MKTIILRKPKFMRSDACMLAYIETAEAMSNCACSAVNSQDVDVAYEYMNKAGECLNKAAEAGGFFTTLDMLNWIEKQYLKCKES